MFRFQTNPLRVTWNVTQEVEVTIPCHKIEFTIFKDQIQAKFTNGAWEQQGALSDLAALDIITRLFQLSVKDHISDIKIELDRDGFFSPERGEVLTKSIIVTVTSAGHKFFQDTTGSLSLKPIWDVLDQIQANIRNRS